MQSKGNHVTSAKPGKILITQFTIGFGFIVELLVKQFFYLFVRPRDLFFIQASQLEKLLPAVLPQFYQGLFSKDKKGSEEAKQRWLDAVKQATTVSRLHLLLEILDSTVIWDLSAENAVC